MPSPQPIYAEAVGRFTIRGEREISRSTSNKCDFAIGSHDGFVHGDAVADSPHGVVA